MPRHEQIPDLVHDSKIETSVTGNRIEHVFYEPGRTPQERQRRRVECWDRDVILGKGAYGIVYKERRCSQAGTLETLRAVKQISKSVVGGEPLDYIRELEAIIKFSHRNYSHCFVRSDGWFEEGDSIYIAMEYIEHGDLQKYLSRPLPESEARQITGQVLEGLHFMHDNGFVHRDLKPGNIMVVGKGPDWFVKIADFGISKRRQKGVTTLHTLQRGTLGFAAPEVLGVKTGGQGGSYTFAVDIWSLGAVTYYILTNKMAFDNATDIVMYAMGMGEFPIQALERNNASEKAKDFVKALLAANPESRPLVAATTTLQWLAEPLTMKPEDVMIDSRSEGSSNKSLFTDFSKASATWTTNKNDIGDRLGDRSSASETDLDVETANDDDTNDDDDEETRDDDRANESMVSQVETIQPETVKVVPRQKYKPPYVEDATDESAPDCPLPLDVDAQSVLDEDGNMTEYEKNESGESELEYESETDASDPVADVNKLWSYWNLQPGNDLPVLKSLRDQESFWRLQEGLGVCIRLHRVTDVVESAELGERMSAGSKTRICYACKRSVPESTSGAEGSCGHWHCVQCISWSLRHAAVSSQALPPSCCSNAITWTLPNEIGLSIESLTNITRKPLVRCGDQNCKRRFEPVYLVKDSKTKAWLVCCPACKHASCFECLQNPDSEDQTDHKSPCGNSGGAQGDETSPRTNLARKATVPTRNR
uniref:Autophagy-related protein 1 n=1 Tax=Bionectria ochroleuca TaxID=29856 RepID=A0A8H7NBH9_BIOOC